MEQKQKDALWAQYTKQTHRLGRVLSLITVALLLGAPFVIGALLGAYPDLGATARGFLSVGLVWTVSSVAEFLIYTPMLGAGDCKTGCSGTSASTPSARMTIVTRDDVAIESVETISFSGVPVLTPARSRAFTAQGIFMLMRLPVMNAR